MTIHIYSWTDGYLALRERAFMMRGAIELDSGARWPRTTGHDVIAIAAMFDPTVRANASPGVLRRWQAALDELKHEGLAEPTTTYAANRSFWASLEVAAIALDDAAVVLPSPSSWHALVHEIGAHAPRNVGPSGDGPFGHFDNIKTYDDLYIAEFKYLRDKRGSDKLAAPTGMAGPEKPIPRSTNADVIQLATYWTAQLGAAKRIMGTDGVTSRWNAAMSDVEKLAKAGKPDDAYTKNNEFWRVLADTAINVAVADEAPTKWDVAKDAIKDSVTHLPENLGAAASKGVDLIASAAHAVGKVANEAGKGLFSGFGTPLLIGAGLLGVFLISRGRSHSEES